MVKRLITDVSKNYYSSNGKFYLCSLKVNVKFLLVNKYVGALVGCWGVGGGARGSLTHLQAKPSLIVLTRRADKERRGDKSIVHNVPIVSPGRDAAVSCYGRG